MSGTPTNLARARLVGVLRAGLLVGAAAAVAYAAVAPTLALGPPIDLDVYRMGAQGISDGRDLYGLVYPIADLRFLYPPFAALGFLPLLWFETDTATVAWLWVALALLARSCHLLGRALSRSVRWPLGPVEGGAVLMVLACVSEPVIEHLRFGQINVLLMWLVLEGLLAADPRGRRGVLVGVAAGIKLTPAVFIVMLALVGRGRTARWAIAGAAATALVGFAILPQDSWAYWTGVAYDHGRAGTEFVANQSLTGTLDRMFGPDVSTLWLRVASAAAIVAGLAIGRRLWHQGLQLGALAAVVIATLLASPISWTHHWVWVVVVAAGLIEVAALRWRPAVALLALTAWLFASDVIWQVPYEDGREFDHRSLELVQANAYVLYGLLLLATLAWVAWGSRRPTAPMGEPTDGQAERVGDHDRPGALSASV